MKTLKIKKLYLLTGFIAALLSISLLLMPSTSFAANEGGSCSTKGAADGNLTCGSCSDKNQDCVWIVSSCANTTGSDGKAVVQSKVQDCLAQSPVIQRIQQIVDFLSAGVGIIVTGVIILGGIQYTLAGGNATALTAARQRITNGVIALFAFLFIFAFLQWLIPGGIFK